jgi:C-terminal processing protease CtpA/Prc
VKIADHFAIFVPMGRAVNPVTGTNWEGTGVKPDIATPAASALDTAYRAALRDQQARISAKDAPGLRAEIDQAISKLK